MRQRGQEARQLACTLRDEPRAFPGAVLRLAKRSMLAIWRARGGGLYACGFLVTFLYLETKMFVTDLVGADGIGDFVTGQLMEKLFRYLGDSIANTITAFVWPAYVLQRDPIWGLGFLVVGFFVFDRYLKAQIESWLSRDETPES